MLNNDFDVLIEKYNRYKRQKSKARNRVILLFVTLLALAYYISTLNFSTDTTPVDKNLSTTKAIKKIKEPSQPKVEGIQKSQEPEVIQERQKVQEVKPKQEKIVPKKSPPKVVVKKETKPKKNSLKVTTNQESLTQLLNNQAISNSYSSTIAVANYHYSHKRFQEAIKWSIEASKKNKSKARPWIIYAKSKKALGKDEIAKKALTLFLKRHQSQEALDLLHSLN